MMMMMMMPLEEGRNYERRLLPESEEKDEALYYTPCNDEVHNITSTSSHLAS
jgi:hypothetical protein